MEQNSGSRLGRLDAGRLLTGKKSLRNGKMVIVISERHERKRTALLGFTLATNDHGRLFVLETVNTLATRHHKSIVQHGGEDSHDHNGGRDGQ